MPNLSCQAKTWPLTDKKEHDIFLSASTNKDLQNYWCVILYLRSGLGCYLGDNYCFLLGHRISVQFKYLFILKLFNATALYLTSESGHTMMFK